MKLDHICLAVRKIDAAGIALTKYLGYAAKTEKVENTRQQVIVQFFSKPEELDIKLIEPSNSRSPLVSFLKKGEGLHHLGYRVNDVVGSLEQLKTLGVRVTTPPQAGEAFDEELIAFAYIGSGLNVELIDTDKRRNFIGE